MGVAYHAHARFLDHQGRRITVRAPVDPQTPAALWWYDWIATNAAALRRAGFTAILYPPVCKTQSGHFNTGDGYGVYDQCDIGSKNQMGSVETRFGSREQLQRSIAVAHACGLDVYVDVVLHQLNGGDNGVYRYLGANGVTGIGRFPKNPGCFRGAPPRRPEDPVPVPTDDFPFGDELVYVNCEPPGYTIAGMIDFGDWLTRSIDCQGYRVDDTKGMAVCFSRDGFGAARRLAPRSTTQVFFGAGDLDIAPALNGDAIVGCIWTAEGTRISAEFRSLLDPWPQRASVAVEILDPAGTSLTTARVTTSTAVPLRATVRRDGWHSFKTSGAGLPSASGVPFELSVTYTAPQELAVR